jgi:hypothetical protein
MSAFTDDPDFGAFLERLGQTVEAGRLANARSMPETIPEDYYAL